MTIFNSYSTGTLSVSNGGTVITGVGTLWSGINARSGDDIVINGLSPIVVMDVTDSTHLVIDPWPFATQTNVSYKIVQRSPLRYAGGQAMADVDTLIASLSNPIFSGTVIAPTIAGGSTSSSTLTFYSTTGAGSTDFIRFRTGVFGVATTRVLIPSAGGIHVNTNLLGIPSAHDLGFNPPFVSWDDGNTWGTALATFQPSGYTSGHATFVSRNSAVGVHTAVVANDTLWDDRAHGSDGSAWHEACTLQVFVDGAVSAGNVPGRYQFNTTSVGGGGSAVERMRIGNAGAVHFPSIGTTASGANAFLNNAASPANQLLRSTSSLRYKMNVEPVNAANRDAVLAIDPIWYRSNAPSDNPDWSFYGMAAEDVAAIDPRLVSWGYADEDWEFIEIPTGKGRTRLERRLKDTAKLIPDAVMYDRVAILQIAALKARIEQLERGRP